jgi:hypothetical protein
MKKVFFYSVFVAILCAGCSKDPSASSAVTSGKGDIVTISNGEAVSLEKNVVKGKYTIFEFYATW